MDADERRPQARGERGAGLAWPAQRARRRDPLPTRRSVRPSGQSSFGTSTIRATSGDGLVRSSRAGTGRAGRHDMGARALRNVGRRWSVIGARRELPPVSPPPAGHGCEQSQALAGCGCGRRARRHGARLMSRQRLGAAVRTPAATGPGLECGPGLTHAAGSRQRAAQAVIVDRRVRGCGRAPPAAVSARDRAGGRGASVTGREAARDKRIARPANRTAGELHDGRGARRVRPVALICRRASTHDDDQ